MGETLAAGPIAEAGTRRAARRLAAREFRPRRVPAAALVALLVTAAGGAGAAEAIARAAGGTPPLAPLATLGGLLRRLSWSDPAVLGVSGALVAAGLALLALAALPGRTAMAPLNPVERSWMAAAGVARGTVRRSLTGAALGVPGIGTVKLRVRGRLRPRVVVRASTHYRNPANLASLIQDAVSARLDRIDLQRRPRVVVRLRWRQD